MPQICLYFQLHQPYRIGNFEIFDLGNGKDFFHKSGKTGNEAIFKKVAAKSYLPMLQLLEKLLQQEPRFCFALSCSGVFLTQAQEFEPEVIVLLKRLVKTGRVELLAETFYHSLAFLYSETEFAAQIELHRQIIWKLFRVKPKVFRNTELIYSDHVGYLVGKLGYLGMLTEAVDRYLDNRPRTQLFVSHPYKLGGTEQVLPLLLKHAQLSDDIAFRFSDKSWVDHPLTVDKYLKWLSLYREDEIVNLFMDFETFGEHQWADSGIFEFFAVLIHQFLESSWNSCQTPSQLFVSWQHQQLKSRRLTHQRSGKIAASLKKLVYDVPQPISWADVDRDLTAWTANELQQDSLRIIASMESKLLALGDKQLLETWRKLQTSDHFYYMCTKWAADGDVHAYFSPYGSPFEAYRRYAIVLADLRAQLAEKSVTSDTLTVAASS